MTDVVNELAELMNKTLAGSKVQVGSPNVPSYLKTLMQLGLSPSKLA